MRKSRFDPGTHPRMPRPAEKWSEGRPDDPGYLDAEAQRRARRRPARGCRRRAVLPPRDPLGQGDERAHDLGRALRLGVGPPGYRYEPRHPSGVPGRRSPRASSRSGTRSRGSTATPDCCLVNFYDAGRAHGSPPGPGRGGLLLARRLGLARRRRALPRGRHRRADPTASHWLRSGDVAVLEGPSRLAFHGIDRVRAGSSTLLDKGGRINLTLRVVY
jgi:DNA oxidative demethylase